MVAYRVTILVGEMKFVDIKLRFVPLVILLQQKR